MKLKSAAGLVCYVKNVPKTVKFYTELREDKFISELLKYSPDNIREVFNE